jgi:hypothetical protein
LDVNGKSLQMAILVVLVVVLVAMLVRLTEDRIGDSSVLVLAVLGLLSGVIAAILHAYTAGESANKTPK